MENNRTVVKNRLLLELFQRICQSQFFRNFFVYVGGGTASKLIGLATFILIGKLLAPEKYAVLILFLLAAEFLSVFVRFGLGSSLVRIMRADPRETLNNSIFAILLLWLFVVSSVIFCTPLILPHLRADYAVLLNYKIPLCARILSMAILEVLSYYYITLEIPRKFVKVNIAFSSLNLIAITVVLVFLNNEPLHTVDYVVWANAICGIGAMGYAVLISRKFIDLSLVSFRGAFQAASESSVFLLKNVIGLFQTYASRIVLSVMASSYLLGVYSYYLTFFAQAAWIFGLFNQAYLPKIRNLVVSKDKDAFDHGKRLVIKAFRTYAIFSGCVLLIGVPLIFGIRHYQHAFSFILRPEYLTNLNLFALMLVAFLLGNVRTFFEVWQYLRIRNVNIHLILSNCIALCFLYFGNLFFYKLFGIYGIILNQILLYLVNFAYIWICYRIFVVYKNDGLQDIRGINSEKAIRT